MKIEVVHKKLGRERAWGQAYVDNNIIELDVRLKGYRYLLYAIHEYLHIANPEWSETKVKRESSKLAKFLWGIGVKRKE